MLDQMEQLSANTAPQAANLRVRLWLTRAERDRDFLTRALHWAEAHEAGLGEAGYYDMTPLTLVRVRIAQRRLTQDHPDLEPALQFLDRYLAYAETWSATGQAIEALNLRALALEAQGDVLQALVAAQRALALGEREGYVYAFVQGGPPMARLLRHVGLSAHSAGYAARLLAAFPEPTDGHGPQRAPTETLTPRETEVLQLVTAGASNPEIAAALFIAVDTVKRHCTHIYRKLGVCNRTQAATRARELGLVE
jgi:LuxR family maltose regulon positive regulatory protein